MRHFWSLTAVPVAWLVAAGGAQMPAPDEDVARRQLESGRAFARQGNYAEALKDFRAVAETHGSSSVADDAWLELARYALDVTGEPQEAAAAVDTILRKYPTSDSAPDAYVIAGRLAMARSRQPADLEEALANFDRVSRLFPASPAVPRALALAGEALFYAGRPELALASLARAEAEHPASPAGADAALMAGSVLVSLGDPLLAIQELQRARDRWPSSPAAATALGRITLLHRLYVRARSGPAYVWSDESAGPARLEGVLALAVTGRQSVYWATESRLGVVTPANADPPPSAARPRGLAVDGSGGLVVLEGGALRLTTGGRTLALSVPRSNGQPEALRSLRAAVQLSNGDWLAMDEEQRSIHRFTRAGAYASLFASTRVVRLAVNGLDEVAGIDRDQKGIVLFDAAGRSTGRIPAKGAGYELSNLEDLAFDAFSHLYALDRGAVAIFTPHPPSRSGRPSAPPGAPGDRGARYRLLTVVVEPEKSPGAFRRATALGVDAAGALYVADDRAQRVLVFR